MKRFGAILLTLCLLLPAIAGAQSGDEHTKTVDVSAFGVDVMRNHEIKTGDKQKLAMDYPTFEGEDETLSNFLNDTITTPILALRKLGQMAEDTAYAQGDRDVIRSGYFASVDFENLLSIEASVSNCAAGTASTETSFFYRLIDLENRRILTVGDLFTESATAVDTAIREAVFRTVKAQGLLLPTLADASAVPLASSYFVNAKHFRCIYDANMVSTNAAVVDVPWGELQLTPSQALVPVQNTPSSEAKNQGGDAASREDALVEQEQTAFQQGAAPAEPLPAPALPEAPEAPEAQPMLDPGFVLPPVQTPTPMPLAPNDAMIADVLTHGLWKPLGSDGKTYYQFTADGKLLTVNVSDYQLTEGMLTSDALNGTVEIGSDSAFTLRTAEGSASGYVLNRMGEAVAPEEFVTPSPIPSPTPTPVPTATPKPTAVVTPTPTAAPTPTLSPYEIALTQAPSLAVLGDARFENARTLKVYSAPDEQAFRDNKAQVTTDDTVSIYGVENGWVLVSYTIGNGSKGRLGYIETSTLADAANVAQLGLSKIPLKLTKNTNATDDPLKGKGTVAKLKKDTEVTLLGFLNGDWAYIQTTYRDKPCRLFVPQTALMED